MQTTLPDRTIAQQEGGWKERKSLTREDWDIHLPFLEGLYMKEQRTLQDVMDIMKERLGFVATEKMYKTNFKRLGLYKYRPRNQPVQTHQDPDLAKRGINYTHIATPETQAVITNMALALPSASQFTTLSNHGLKRPLSLGGVFARVETLLWNMSVYLKPWLNARVSVPWLFSISSGSWNWHILRGFTMLSLSHADKAWDAFGKACEVAGKMMGRQYNDLLLGFVAVFSQHWMFDFTDVRLSIIRYLTKLAATRLGCQHPLTIVFFHFLDDEVSAQSIGNALQMLVETAGKEPPLLQRSIWALDHARCCRLIDEENFELAQESAARLFEDTHMPRGSKGILRRSALLRQGDISFGLGNMVDAQDYYEKAINLAKERHGHPFPDAVGVDAVSRLARLHACSGDLVTARHFCTEALENPLTPLSEPDATGIRLALKATLEETMNIGCSEATDTREYNFPCGGGSSSRSGRGGGRRRLGGGGAGMHCHPMPTAPPGH